MNSRECAPQLSEKFILCVYVRVCVCVYQKNPLSYPEISVIPVQLSLEVSFLKKN